MSLYFLGDVHARCDDLFALLDRANLAPKSLIVQVGDLGVGFPGFDTLSRLHDGLGERDVVLCAIRGNHDNPAYFAGSHRFAALQLVEDYTVITHAGFRILMVGGATSIDRAGRFAGRDYWPDESFRFRPDRLPRPDEPLDIVVTHSCPASVGVPPLLPPPLDRRLRDDLAFERDEHERLYRAVRHPRLARWYFGHFHRSHVETIGSTTFRGLAELELVAAPGAPGRSETET